MFQLRLSVTVITDWTPRWHSSREPTCNAGDVGDRGSIPGSGRSPRGGTGNPLRYPCWEIPRTEEPGGLQLMGSQRAGRDWAHRRRAGWVKAWTLAPALWLDKYLSWSSGPSSPSSPSSNPSGATPCLPVLRNGCQCQTSEPSPTTLVPGKQAFRGLRVKDEHSGLAKDLQRFHTALSWQRK